MSTKPHVSSPSKENHRDLLSNAYIYIFATPTPHPTLPPPPPREAAGREALIETPRHEALRGQRPQLAHGALQGAEGLARARRRGGLCAQGAEAKGCGGG